MTRIGAAVGLEENGRDSERNREAQASGDHDRHPTESESQRCGRPSMLVLSLSRTKPGSIRDETWQQARSDRYEPRQSEPDVCPSEEVAGHAEHEERYQEQDEGKGVQLLRLAVSLLCDVSRERDRSQTRQGSHDPEQMAPPWVFSMEVGRQSTVCMSKSLAKPVLPQVWGPNELPSPRTIHQMSRDCSFDVQAPSPATCSLGPGSFTPISSSYERAKFYRGVPGTP